ncbi:neuronal acetylcholine receptor subunit alpha-6-like [Centruroides sculpturatus]|uniref:neuronal acetylcholine receptor subunit alpha-6-like n=2 Tax=Centruroides sculpturatus TaxID=218467 RepID=UPI000C6EACF9|nr:neuronal acetylcholine receptor subunit alpha-6-like [Centruroides sculpturatus]
MKITFIIFIGFFSIGCFAQYPYQQLRQDLLKDYDKFSRPVRQPSTGITIETSITPLYISDLNEDESKLTVEGWISFKWKDDILMWDPSKYSGITSISIPNSEVWKPDLSVYNSHPAKLVVETLNGETNMLISNDGTVMWIPPITFSTFCIINRSGNDQKCNITIGSWTENVNYINLKLSKDKVDTSHFSNTNPKWEVVRFEAIRQERFYECCPEAYVSISYIFELRKWHSKAVNAKEIMCGTTLIAIILTLAMFWLPSDSEKKFTLGAVSLLILAMILLLGHLSKPGLEVAASFTRNSLFIMAAAILVEIVIVNISSMKTACKTPKFLTSGIIGRVLLLNSTESSNQYSDAEKNSKITIQANFTDQKSACQGWSIIATACDRIFFFVFLLTFIIERSF